MNAQNFLSQEDQKQIMQCVADVEKKTSGEIVPLITTASSDYPTAQATASCIAGLLFSVVICVAFGQNDMWTALAAFVVAYTLISMLMNKFPSLCRVFTQKREMREKVEEGAMTAFHVHGLHNTRDKTGILIYISVHEKMVHILADSGIDQKVQAGTWDEVVTSLSKGIREGKQAQAICEAIRHCGELLTEKFPVKTDDTNELPDLIIK